MVKLFLVQVLSPFVFRNVGSELCMLQQLKVVEGMRVSVADSSDHRHVSGISTHRINRAYSFSFQYWRYSRKLMNVGWLRMPCCARECR